MLVVVLVLLATCQILSLPCNQLLVQQIPFRMIPFISNAVVKVVVVANILSLPLPQVTLGKGRKGKGSASWGKA